MKLVEIVWVDSFKDESHSIPLECIKDMTPITRRNVGYLILDEPDKVTIVNGILENFRGETAYDSPMVFPRGMVVKIEQLNKVDDA